MDFYADELRIDYLYRIEPHERDAIKRSGFGFDASYVVKRIDSNYLQKYKCHVWWHYPDDIFHFTCKMRRFHEQKKTTEGILSLFYENGICSLARDYCDVNEWDASLLQPFILTIKDVVKMSKIFVPEYYNFVDWESIKNRQESGHSNANREILVEKLNKAIMEKFKRAFPAEGE
jgi:hypothetical protein